jgi:glycosyltransferase involved in cell wall biosynthesis
MKVLHLIPSISPRRGGPSQAIVAMVAGLRQQGVEASILTTNDDGPDVLSSMPLGVWHEHQGVPVLAFDRWSPPQRALREFAIAPALTGWLWQHLTSFDLLHVHALFSYASTTGMAVARVRNVPYVLRPLGLLNRWSLQQSVGRKKLMRRLIENRNIQQASALHFTSEAERQEVSALHLHHTDFVLPLGVSLPQFAPLPRQPGADIRFLFLSRLHPKKQLPVLLEAMALLQQRHPEAEWTLQIAGEGEPIYLRELQAHAKRLGLIKRLQWLGFVAGQAKQDLLNQADWFLLPSASENFGIAAAEALAAGTPVILAPGVALAEAVSTAGAGWISHATPEALAARLEICLVPPPDSMRQCARRLAKEVCSWNSISEALKVNYQSMIDRHHDQQSKRLAHG